MKRDEEGFSTMDLCVEIEGTCISKIFPFLNKQYNCVINWQQYKKKINSHNSVVGLILNYVLIVYVI